MTTIVQAVLLVSAAVCYGYAAIALRDIIRYCRSGADDARR